jgi:hypothetical protein
VVLGYFEGHMNTMENLLTLYGSHAMSIKITVLWNVMSCSMVDKFPQNIGIYIPYYMASNF